MWTKRQVNILSICVAYHRLVSCAIFFSCALTHFPPNLQILWQNVAAKEKAIKDFLQFYGWNIGLTQAFLNNATKVSHRYIITDCSAVMRSSLTAQLENRNGRFMWVTHWYKNYILSYLLRHETLLQIAQGSLPNSRTKLAKSGHTFILPWIWMSHPLIC